jgi:hypothetical protein
MNTYTVSIEFLDTDDELIVTVQTEADLDNCDEDILRSDIEEHLETDHGIDMDSVAHWDFV